MSLSENRFPLFRDMRYRVSTTAASAAQVSQTRSSQPIGRSTSADFLHWNLPEVVLAPDAADPPDTQFYAMPVFRYEGHYIGLIWVFHTLPLVKDAQLAFSRDGVRWRRPACRPVCSTAGEPNAE